MTPIVAYKQETQSRYVDKTEITLRRDQVSLLFPMKSGVCLHLSSFGDLLAIVESILAVATSFSSHCRCGLEERWPL